MFCKKRLAQRDWWQEDAPKHVVQPDHVDVLYPCLQKHLIGPHFVTGSYFYGHVLFGLQCALRLLAQVPRLEYCSLASLSEVPDDIVAVLREPR